MLFVSVTLHSCVLIASDRLQPDGCNICFINFFINSTPIWRLGNLASREASIDFTALGI